ncbi:phosphoglycolate phosphatase, bacterial [Aureimonas endophytica]|uniref:Phosphoglycolate phosphatase n=1 Tax=Aureimonas endophytica TaxID=2027858 RepID=A0A916ZE73_9HYPH|nr:HAD-IA family hydrolase [Aureimonas endophytica]GGD91430.1 phosphoglycolate phosphatase, bacterial [Aureimonas endophytica]
MPLAVFDLDGTLVDTAPDLLASLNHCLLAAGLPATVLETVRPFAGHGARVMLEQAYRQEGRLLSPADLDEQLPRFLAFYEAHIADASRPFEGAVAAMDRLTQAGFTLAICTNKTERLARILMETLGLAERFAAICGADTFAQRKPHPAHLLGTIARAGGIPATSVMIGDTATDTDAAAGAGLPAILVDFGYAPDLRARTEASAIVTSYAELGPELCHRLIGAGRD